MSFDIYKKIIEEGDTIILYVGFNSMYPVHVTPTKYNKSGVQVDHTVQTTFGGLRVVDLIGQRFGTRVKLSRGYAYALHPTPGTRQYCIED